MQATLQALNELHAKNEAARLKVPYICFTPEEPLKWTLGSLRFLPVLKRTPKGWKVLDKIVIEDANELDRFVVSFSLLQQFVSKSAFDVGVALVTSSDGTDKYKTVCIYTRDNARV